MWSTERRVLRTRGAVRRRLVVVLAIAGVALAAVSALSLGATPRAGAQAGAAAPGVLGMHLYLVHYEETGLPQGSTWWVNGSEERATSSNGTTLAVLYVRGGHEIQFGAPTGYGVVAIEGPHHPSLSQVSVSGNCRFAVRFAPLEVLTFQEHGLPAGTSWSVSLHSWLGHGGAASQSGSSTGTTIAFTVVKGGWMFQVGDPVGGFAANPGHGYLVVPAGDLTRGIGFHSA